MKKRKKNSRWKSSVQDRETAADRMTDGVRTVMIEDRTDHVRMDMTDRENGTETGLDKEKGN